MSARDVFDIFVVNDEGKGLQGVRVVVRATEKSGPEWNRKYGSVSGVTDANGWFGIGCHYAFRGEVFLNNKSYGFYWCGNGVSVSIKI